MDIKTCLLNITYDARTMVGFAKCFWRLLKQNNDDNVLALLCIDHQDEAQYVIYMKNCQCSWLM